MLKKLTKLHEGSWSFWLSGGGEPKSILRIVEYFSQVFSSEIENIETADCLWKIHDGGRSTVFGAEFEGKKYCIKLFHDDRLQTRFRTFLGWAKGRRAFKNGLLAIEKNIPVPPVYAYAEKNPVGPVFLLMKFVDATQMNLLLEGMVADGVDLTNDPVFYEMIESFARFTKNLHLNSICHKDFSPRNVLLCRKNERFDMKLIDLEDLTFSGNATDYKRNIEHFTFKLARYIDQPALDLFRKKLWEDYEEQVLNK